MQAGERVWLSLAAWTLLLSLVPAATAGDASAPEVTDAEGDHTAEGIPLGSVPASVAEAADIVAGWIGEDSQSISFTIQVAGDIEAGIAGEPLGLGARYEYEFHFTHAGVDQHASAVVSDGTVNDGVVAGGLATAATVDGATINLTVPKSALPGLAPDDALSGFEITAEGTLTGVSPIDVLGVIADEAASDSTYVVLYAVGGVAGDADGDGLDDGAERAAFGDLNETAGGDPDGDGLNNSQEFGAGTDANDPDTDGDGLDDAADPFPLDATRPADADGDGLPDAWERSNFNTTAAQNGTGDPDRDGLNNTRENALGTDPNVADTDLDGANDADDPSPLDPDESGATDADPDADEGRVEIYAGSLMFAAASTFILLGLAKGI